MTTRPLRLLVPIFGLALALLWHAPGPAGAAPTGTAKKAPAKTAAPKEKPWKLYAPDDKSFTILFPEDPKTTERELGGGKSVRLVDAKLGGENYALMYMERGGGPASSAAAKDVLQAGADAYVQQCKGTLLKKKMITVSGLPAIELEVKNEAPGPPPVAIISIVRIVLARDRFYQITATYMAKKGKPDHARRFMGSFKLASARR